MDRVYWGFAIIVALVGCVLTVGEMQPVYAWSRQSKEAGEQIFKTRGCEHCHGLDGIGTQRAPGLSTVGKRLKPAQIRQQILQGGKGMPAFGAILKEDEVTALVDFLKAKKKAPKMGGEAGLAGNGGHIRATSAAPPDSVVERPFLPLSVRPPSANSL